MTSKMYLSEVERACEEPWNERLWSRTERLTGKEYMVPGEAGELGRSLIL